MTGILQHRCQGEAHMDVSIRIHVARRHCSRLRNRTGEIVTRRAVYTGGLRAEAWTGNRQDITGLRISTCKHRRQTVGSSGRVQIQVRRLRRGKCLDPL